MTLLGLVGVGRIGAFHAATLRGLPGVELVVADAQAGRAEALARSLGVRWAPGVEALLDERLAAVVIATPTGSHAELIERGVAAGIPVFCEKPVAETSAKTLEVVKAVDKYGGRVQIRRPRRRLRRPPAAAAGRRRNPDLADRPGPQQLPGPLPDCLHQGASSVHRVRRRMCPKPLHRRRRVGSALHRRSLRSVPRREPSGRYRGGAAVISDRIAGAPISWGVCEVPGWGYQLPAERVLAEMRAVGLAATGFRSEGFLPGDAARRRALLDQHRLTAVGGFVPVVLHEPDHDPWPQVKRALNSYIDADILVLAAATGRDDYESRPRLGADGWRRLFRNLDRIRVRAAALGIRGCLRPHDSTTNETTGDVA